MNVAVILSGGTGTRVGGTVPKQYIEVGGKPVIAYCLHMFLAHEDINAVQIVAEGVWREYILRQLSDLPNKEKFRGFSAPGENRQLSIYHALCDIKQYASDEDMVMIHDAARPCVAAEQISGCFKASDGHDGALPVLPMKDTVYYSEEENKVSSLLNRSKIFAGQAPECFVLGKYLEANRRLLPKEILKINGSAEPAVMAGMDIAMLTGDENNFKITTKADLERFRRIAGERNGGLE